ncbi:YwdI family protein [Neobacillus rhizosphaerae]|uniref:YwdI family protein n=1 Tax=Neobacillus rhizosphaerae TaxID=2880965 RepID=UPI003D2ADFE1
MNISIQKLLTKIEEELKQAKTAHMQESLREKVYSIKILCELILDDQPAAQSERPLNAPAAAKPVHTQPVYQPVVAQPVFQQPAPVQQGKKLEMDNEANGDSLFDF